MSDKPRFIYSFDVDISTISSASRSRNNHAAAAEASMADRVTSCNEAELDPQHRRWRWRSAKIGY